MFALAMARRWRQGLLLLVVLGSLAFLRVLPPIGQDPRYHQFADQRPFFGIPNFMDVASNLPFLLAGLAGLRVCRRRGFAGFAPAWAVFFAGVALVSAGSAYYHWRPDNHTLVWDRLPMTLAFMALFAALLGESLGERLGRLLLGPALLAGLASVVYWHLFDDLRFYLWVQSAPLLAIPVCLLLFGSPHPRRWLLLPALGCYLLAKLAEVCDARIFALSGNLVGGHALKHLLAAAAVGLVAAMLGARRREPPGR
jgi:hypothetical protein